MSIEHAKIEKEKSRRLAKTEKEKSRLLEDYWKWPEEWAEAINKAPRTVQRHRRPSPSIPQAPSTFLLDEPRPMRPDELTEVRAMWWRLAAQGIRMPAELGVILLDADHPRLNPPQTERQK